MKEVISTPLLNTYHPNEGLSNVLVEACVGNAAEAHFINEMGITLAPDDINTVFRLGKPDRTRAPPSPVKIV